MPKQHSFNILHKQMEHLYISLPSGLAAIVMTIVVAIVMLYGEVATLHLVAWGCVNIFILIVRIVLWRHYKQTPLTPQNIQFFYKSFFLLAIMTSLGIASSTLIIFPDALIYQMILVLMALSISAGAVVSFGSRIEIFMAYTILLLLPFVLVFLFSHAEGSVAFAFIIFVYASLLMVLSKKVSLNINTNIGLAFENEKLVVELSQQRDRAEALAKVKSNFLSNMSHELRTPLNSVIGFSQILVRNKTLGEREQEYAQKITTSGEHLLKLINSVLDLSKLESKGMAVVRERVNIKSVARTVLAQLETQAGAKKIALSLSCAMKEEFCFTDELRLVQVLTNLVANGIKFTQSGSVSLQISLADENKLRFAIKDTGIGMTPQQLEKLFLPFSQADDSITRKFGGTGLGLAISKEIVELMGGRIWVESEFGAGSTFIFELPFEVS